MTTERKALQAPIRHLNIPLKAQWLAGEGAGSWFWITLLNNQFKIIRYSPSGKIECEGLFNQVGASTEFDLHKDYTFTHLSHCQKVTISQNNHLIELVRTGETSV